MKRAYGHLGIGLRRDPFRFFKSWFLAYSAAYTILSSLAFFFPALRPASWNVWVVIGLVLMAVLGLLWGLYRVYPQRSVQIRMKSIDATVEVRFGDLFEAQGMKVIAVNEFFDSQIGAPVARFSLHGQLIERMFRDRPEQFDELIDKELRGMPFEEAERPAGRRKRYDIGTTPVISVGAEQFLLPALTKTDVDTYKAYCNIPMLLKALDSLWSAVRNRAGGQPVSAPLIGGGLSGIGLPPYQLLQLMILSIVMANKQGHVRSKIQIVLAYDLMEEIDLRTLESQWS